MTVCPAGTVISPLYTCSRRTGLISTTPVVRASRCIASGGSLMVRI